MKKASNPLFQQEYPEDEESCFLQTAEAFFDSSQLNSLLMQCYPASIIQDNTHIWFEPEKDHIYVLGADPTVGVKDPAAFTIWDLLGLKLCARFKGVLEPVSFAEKLKSFGRKYNQALLVVENNNPGVAVLSYLMDYENLFYMRDINTGKPTGRPGWTTTAQSKAYMLQQFRKLLPELTIYDAELIREAKAFRYNGLNVETGGDDHLMMSAMLALSARETATPVNAFVGVAGWTRW